MAVRVREAKIMQEMPKLEDITIGADPELFLVRPDGKFISSIGLIGGSKMAPKSIGNGCAVQEDNVAVEFNIAPCKQADQFIARCSYVLEYLTKTALDNGLILTVQASKSFDEDQLKHPKAQEFGCESDFNCWTKKKNPSPKAADPNLRTTGGHIHIGGVKDMDRFQLGRWCDITMGLSSVLEDDIPGTIERRELYGKAGTMRIKPYGIEYRTLSPYWLNSGDLMKRVYARALDAVDRVANSWEIKDEEGVDIQEAINRGDKKLAEQLLAMYNVH